MSSEIDAYLLSFFGSLENAKAIGHLYVLEQKPLKIDTEPDSDGLTFKMSISTEYRLRLKTKEELEAEQNPQD